MRKLLVTIPFGPFAGEAALSPEDRGTSFIPLFFSLIFCRACLEQLGHGTGWNGRSDRSGYVVFLFEIDLTQKYDVLAANNVQSFGDISISVSEVDALNCVVQEQVG